MRSKSNLLRTPPSGVWSRLVWSKLTLTGLPLTWLALLGFVLACGLTGCGQAQPGDEVAYEQESEFEETPVLELGAAVVIPSGFTDELFVNNVSDPTTMAFAPDGRLFVCQQGGQVRVIRNGALLPTPFVSLSVDSQGERGLLGITFDPNFASNQYVYIFYTTTSGGLHNRISRFTANGDVAVAGSEVVLMDLEPLTSATNHNGGALHFGPGGKLFAAVGENAVAGNSQTLSNRLGKLLRFNTDGSIPSDNPFFQTATGVNRSIWALGLRNPFTFAFQPGSGRVFINDVGYASWEEINDGIAGANYGWPNNEGPTTDPAYRSPLYAYPHSGNGYGCAITGGTFYNPSVAAFPTSYVGKYFFAEYCQNVIRLLDPANATAQDFATGISAPVDLDVGPDGFLYYLARGTNSVGRIRPAVSEPPVITNHPTSRTVAAGQSVTFSVAASGSQPLTYQWQRGDVNIPGATSPSLTFTAAANHNNSTYRAVVTNSFGTATSNSATLTVASNTAPVPTISTPTSGSLFSAGETLAYSGTATDAEDGTLPASAFTWEIVFHHDTHTHPFMPPTSGSRSGSVSIPRQGETATNVWYRIRLTVRDSSGLTTTVERDVHPRLTTLRLRTTPANLQVMLDGTPMTTPVDVPSVVGMSRVLGVVSPQTQGGTNYAFASWSDGGSASHTINAPSAPTTYTATYNPAPVGQGLRAEYFDETNFTASRLVRTDSTLNFDWESGAPDPSIGVDTFSVRWTGSVVPRFTEAYRFYTLSDDGIRVWVGGVQIINNFTDHAATEDSGLTAVLTAGQAYPIVVEYFESGGLATAKLSWSSNSQAKEIVPSAQLRTDGGTVNPPTRINFQITGAPTPAGYFADDGAVFGARSGGMSYGWNTSHTDVCRDRNVNADQRLDTLCHFHAGGVWELVVPNGQYSVFVSIGDPSYGSTHTLNVEGVNYWNALALNPNQFSSRSQTVNVTDGRLTVNQGSAGEMATRIDYIEITRL